MAITLKRPTNQFSDFRQQTVVIIYIQADAQTDRHAAGGHISQQAKKQKKKTDCVRRLGWLKC